MNRERSLTVSNTVLVAAIAAIVAATAGVANLRHVIAGDAVTRLTSVLHTTDAAARMGARHAADIAAMQTFRPGFRFWQHVFAIPDGSVVFGSALDGRRLAVVRASKGLDRESIAGRLAAGEGPVLHNETRGTFASPGLDQYGSLFAEWGTIYARFGVPREIGLAQALLESGFIGTRRSEADAVGLCQFLESNWKLIDRLDPSVLEIENQTTQAAYCAAYLMVLSTKYDSFIPALSDHHAGGTNVGRVLVNGERLGGKHPRDQYFLGSDLAVGLRTIGVSYSDIYGSYGPRSYRYAEMVFGNASRIEHTIANTRQTRVYAMRTDRAIAIDEIVRRSGLSPVEIQRFNPALTKQVPAGATLYLPAYDAAFGADVSFWHRDAPVEYRALLDEFTAVDVTLQEWETPRFAATLKEFERRFRETGTEEGTVMATVLSYVRREAAGPRATILSTFRNSPAVLDLFAQGVRATEHAAE
ncbi:MAG: hypothetical protein M3R55_02360 [Acidobacteriota bacterium]|nr:hypothetical protein [Acidobacteriota bacterium]